MLKVLCFVILALISATLSQQESCSCSSGCRPPYSDASCVNGVWEYSGNLVFEGTMDIRCPIRVTGDVSIRAGTTLNFVPCARIDVARNFLANDGVGVTLDLQNTDPTVGLRYRFLSYGGTASGFISNVGLSNLGGTGRAPSLIARLRNGEGSIGFGNPDAPSDLSSENGDVNTPRPIPGSSSPPARTPSNPPPPRPSPSSSPSSPVSGDSDFDANGDRINKCNTYTCTNPSVCNQITDDATCDASTGEWVIPTDFFINSATIACPVRIQGEFGVNGPLRIGGCANINVQGRTTLRLPTGTGIASWVPLTFDLNDYGRPRVGNRIRWLQSTGGITGNFGGVGAENIWDLTGTVGVANQICGNDVTLHFYAAGQTAPATNCNPSAGTTRSRAQADDEFANEELDAVNMIDANEAAVSDSDMTATTPSSSASSAPGYAYALFAIAVFILIALVVIQVQIVLVGRAKEAARH